MCYEGGFDPSSIFIKKEQTSKDVAEYDFPFVSLIPLYDSGCYVKLYYNGNVLEDTIYISKEGHILNQSDKWKINRVTPYLNYYRFSVRKFYENKDLKGN